MLTSSMGAGQASLSTAGLLPRRAWTRPLCFEQGCPRPLVGAGLVGVLIGLIFADLPVNLGSLFHSSCCLFEL